MKLGESRCTHMLEYNDCAARLQAFTWRVDGAGEPGGR